MSRYMIDQLSTKFNVHSELRSEVVALHGNEHLEAIDVLNHADGTTSRRPTAALFAFIGADTDTAWLANDIARDSRGFILTGADVIKKGKWRLDRDPYLVETSVPGILRLVTSAQAR